MKRILGFCLIFLLMAPLTFAGAYSDKGSVDQSEEKYFSIKSVQLEEIQTSDEVQAQWFDSYLKTEIFETRGGLPGSPDWPGGGYDPTPNPYPYPPAPQGGGQGSQGGGGSTSTGIPQIDAIVNIGKIIWNIIEANKPVADVKTDVAHAIPVGLNAKNWTAMAGWKAPMIKTYHVTYKNGFDSDVIDFQFRLLYVYGGSYKGKGQYIMNATIVPADLKVSWGFTFNANVNINTVFNAGTVKNPIAAMQMQLAWTVQSMFTNRQSTENFYIRGDGEVSTTARE